MNYNEFGNVELVWNETPEGLLLRENDGVVLLELHFDDKNQSVSVLHQFGEDVSLMEETDYRDCLLEARKYEPDLSVPIYVKSLAALNKEKNKEQERICKECVMARCGTHPWNYSSKVKCSNCTAIKS